MSRRRRPGASNDPFWDDLQTAARAARSDPAAWLAQDNIYGDLADAPAFRDAFLSWLPQIWADGAAATVRRYLG